MRLATSSLGSRGSTQYTTMTESAAPVFCDSVVALDDFATFLERLQYSKFEILLRSRTDGRKIFPRQTPEIARTCSIPLFFRLTMVLNFLPSTVCRSLPPRPPTIYFPPCHAAPVPKELSSRENQSPVVVIRHCWPRVLQQFIPPPFERSVVS